MKIFGFKSALAMLTFSAMSLFFQAPTQAQVNKKVLAEVIKSCQRDMNIEYFEKMGMKEEYLYQSQIGRINPVRDCIKYRYRHMALVKQLPWLPYAGDTISEYSGSVAISEILFHKTKLGGRAYYENPKRILSCLIDQDPKSVDCYDMWVRSKYSYSKYGVYDMVPYICPKCAIALNDSSSIDMIKGILQWFLLLDKPKRRELVSAFESLDQKLDNEGWEGLQAYDDAVKKIEQDDKEQRRRNLLGQ
jgi:hypothetical protein